MVMESCSLQGVVLQCHVPRVNASHTTSEHSHPGGDATHLQPSATDCRAVKAPEYHGLSSWLSTPGPVAGRKLYLKACRQVVFEGSSSARKYFKDEQNTEGSYLLAVLALSRLGADLLSHTQQTHSEERL